MSGTDGTTQAGSSGGALAKLLHRSDLLVAVTAAAIALASAVFSYEQTVTAKAQNTASQQQSLVDLVTDISQKLQSLADGQTTQLEVQENLIADAAQGLHLANELGPANVPAVDDYEIGTAFANSGEDRNALTVYERAARGNDTHYKVFSLRAIAQLLYELAAAPPDPTTLKARRTARSEARAAEKAIDEARNAYNGQIEMTGYAIARSEAYTDLFDITQSTLVSCARLTQHMADARRLIASYPEIRTTPSGPGTVQVELPLAASSLAEKCPRRP